MFSAATFCHRVAQVQSIADGYPFMLCDAIARGWENLVCRWGGPMSFRCLIQPTVAIAFAVRAGLKDARQNDPPFLSAVRSCSGSRRARLRQAWTDVGTVFGTVFIVALILDSIYQVFVHASVSTLELLITATVLALLQYVVLRSCLTWIATRVGAGTSADRSMANDEESGA